jgi:hypothetical protein
MQPSADQNGSAATGSGALRRWGPIVAIVAVLAIVGGIIAFSGDDDDGDGATDTASTDDGTSDGEGAISYSQAQAEDRLDELTFPESCDPGTGLVSMPNSLAPECYANVDDNGGATARGVTADTIKVVVYLAPETDPVLDFITAPINADDTNAQIRATYQGFVDMFNATYQTYGRKVELTFLDGSGLSQDEVQARADAVKAIEELDAFAVWSGPVLSNAWTEEIKARGGVCLGCPGLRDAAPSAFTITPTASQIRQHFVEYLSKKLAGKPAEHAGDESMRDKERVFGQLYIDTGSQDIQDGLTETQELLDAAGIEFVEKIGYELDPGTLAEQASTAIARLQAANVTTVIIGGDPIAPKTFTEVATQQGYRPEWVLNGAALQDTTAFGRTYDQGQWSHAFGISSLAARVANGLGDAERLYQWWAGEYPPADDVVGVLYPNPAMFFRGLQAAGPNLTVESFRAGMFAVPPTPSAVTAQIITFGDHGIWNAEDYAGIDDFTELWWDPTVEGPDEIRKEGVGMYRYVDGGKRYLLGDWPEELKVFDPAGTTTVYQELPPGEEPADVPPFPGSPAAG